MTTSAPACYVLTMPRIAELPPENLTRGWLTEPALARAASFASVKRRADYLWVRLMMRVLLMRFFGREAVLKERPPFSPLIVARDSGVRMPLYATISHTKTLVGVAVADTPTAIDLEVIDADRPVATLYKRLYGERRFEKVRDNPVRAFYEAWGMNECAVKLPGVFVTGEEELAVKTHDGQKAAVFSEELTEKTLLTVVTAEKTDLRLLTTTAEEVAASLTAETAFL